MKKIFVTGASGFIGSNLVRELIKDKNNEVHILIRQSSNLWRIQDILKKENLTKHVGDLLDFQILKELLIEIKPDFIIHTAIYGGLPGEKDLDKILKTNFIGTVNLVEASKDIDYKLFINTGTSSEYGQKEKPMKEIDLLEPNNEYGVSKSAATLYCNFFAKKNKKPIITLRLFSPYGYFEEKNRLFPYVIVSCLKDENLEIGNPSSARDFIFIEDVVDAYIKIIKSKKELFGEIFNIGSGKQHSVGEVVRLVFEILGKKKEITQNQDKKRSFDTNKWVSDISKIKKVFKWEPKHSLKEGLKKDIEWFKNQI